MAFTNSGGIVSFNLLAGVGLNFMIKLVVGICKFFNEAFKRDIELLWPRVRLLLELLSVSLGTSIFWVMLLYVRCGEYLVIFL